MNDVKKYLYQNPESGVYTGFWACSRPHGKYTGIWPFGLIARVFCLIGKPKTILEPFGGISKLGVSIDWNRHVKPTIIADAQHLPIRDESVDGVFVDPPYDSNYVQHYSDLDQRIKRTKPKYRFYHAFAEAGRVCKPGGHVVLLHTLIPKHIGRENFRRVATIGISTGPNKRIRCLTVFRKFKGKQSHFSTCS